MLAGRTFEDTWRTKNTDGMHLDKCSSQKQGTSGAGTESWMPHHFRSALLSRHSLHFQGRSACPAHVSVSRTGLFCRISPFAVRDGIYIYISCGLTSPARYYNLLPSNLSRSLYGCAHCSSNLFRHLLLLK